MEISYEIREFRQTDYPFIRDSYLNSFKNSDFGQLIAEDDSDNYYNRQGDIFDKAADKGKLFVACNPKDTDQILGWVLCNHVKMTLDYVYVKEIFRSKGLGFALLMHCQLAEPVKHTHYTNQFVLLTKGKSYRTPHHVPSDSKWSKVVWKYDPYPFVMG
ncbi:MAG: hypothetical protein GY861_01115 [bacterium]|nr:hypothetical protein [bacterium]